MLKKQIAIEKEKRNIRDYAKSIKYQIMTTRFNNDTEKENANFRITRGISEYCVYGCPVKITENIKPDSKIIVLEMNNDQNRIIGVGLIINRLIHQNYKIYSNPSYNRYLYLGRNRIKREELTEEEEFTLKILDKLCFEGKLHSKRGHGVRSFPIKMLYRCRNLINLEQNLVDMFKKRQSNIKTAN